MSKQTAKDKAAKDKDKDAKDKAAADKPEKVPETNPLVLALAFMHECSPRSARKHLEKNAKDAKKLTAADLKKTLEALNYDVAKHELPEGVKTVGQFIESKPWGRYIVAAGEVVVTITNRTQRQEANHDDEEIKLAMRCVYKG